MEEGSSLVIEPSFARVAEIFLIVLSVEPILFDCVRMASRACDSISLPPSSVSENQSTLAFGFDTAQKSEHMTNESCQGLKYSRAETFISISATEFFFQPAKVSPRNAGIRILVTVVFCYASLAGVYDS